MSKIAIAQVQSSTDKADNLKKALRLIDQAKRQGAELVAFPEFLMAFSPSSQSAAELSALAESVDGPFIAALRESAREAKLGVLAAIYETSPITHPCQPLAANKAVKIILHGEEEKEVALHDGVARLAT